MEITKLYSPIRVSLHENGFVSENLYDNALPAIFVDAINTAIRDNPYTRATENGLIQYFIDDNKAYEIFVKEHVQYAHPTVQHVGDSLNIVLEIGSDITLPAEIIDAIKDHIEFLYMNDWASEIEELAIPIQNAALHESASLLGLREDMELTYPDYPFRLLNKPSLILNVYDSKWFYIKTETELQALGKNIADNIQNDTHFNAQKFESRMNTLLPNLDAEAIKTVISYAEELDRDGTEPKETFFKETYIEYYLINKHYGQELARQLFDLSIKGCLNPFEIRGAANLLQNGVDYEKVAQMAIDGLCERDEREWQESKDTLKAFDENNLDNYLNLGKPIKAYIRKNNSDMPDDYAGIVLPTTAKDLQTALEKLNFKPHDIDRCVINGIVLPRCLPTEVAGCFEDGISLIAIDRLNYMVGEIQKIAADDSKQDKLAAALAWVNDGYDAYPKIIGVPFESDSLDDVLNVMLNLDNFTLRRSIIREEDLGKQIVREEIEAGIRTQDEIDEYFDYDDYAHEIAEKQNGLFYGGYYVACSSFTHYMDMDNAIPESNRVWVDAVTKFLPENQRNKGFEYFRPNIDYTALAEGKTGIATLDLAAKIEEFCRTARTSGFNYDGGDIEARGRSIIEIANMCEKRDKSVIAMLDEVAEHLLVVPDVMQDEDFATLTNLKYDFYSLEKEYIIQMKSEFEGGHCGDDERLISGIIKDYPENMRNDPAVLTLLVNRELHKYGIEDILQQLNKSNMIDEPSPDVDLFQLLPADLQVQLEIEHDLMHQLAQVKIAHENRIIDLYDKEIAVCQNNHFQQKVLPATKSREQTKKRLSFSERLRELSEKVKNEPPRQSVKGRKKDQSL